MFSAAQTRPTGSNLAFHKNHPRFSQGSGSLQGFPFSCKDTNAWQARQVGIPQAKYTVLLKLQQRHNEVKTSNRLLVSEELPQCQYTAMRSQLHQLSCGRGPFLGADRFVQVELASADCWKGALKGRKGLLNFGRPVLAHEKQGSSPQEMGASSLSARANWDRAFGKRGGGWSMGPLPIANPRSREGSKPT